MTDQTPAPVAEPRPAPRPINPTGAKAGYRATFYVDLDADSSLRYLCVLTHVGCETVNCGHGGQGVGPSLEAAMMDARFVVNRAREADAR